MTIAMSNESAVEMPSVSPSAAKSASGETILIVDDSRFNRLSLGKILERSGFRVLEAENGPLALELARRRRPDLVLLDVHMPGMSGFDVCRTLQDEGNTFDVPVVFLSGVDDAGERIRALDLGAVDFVNKGATAGEVLARVRTQLRLSQLTRHLSQISRELMDKQMSLEKDLQAAGEIQAALLPRPSRYHKNLRLAWRFQPCDLVGGDIFNVIEIDDERTALYMADVSGHGVPAALIAVSLAQTLSDWKSSSSLGPDEILEVLDQEYPIERFGRMFTICVMVLDTRRGTVEYASAGHPPPILMRRDGELARLGVGSPPIGLGDSVFDTATLTVEPGDRVFLYTDGVIEHRCGAGAQFGLEGLEAALHSTVHSTLDEACDRILRGMDQHSTKPRVRDDVSLLAAEISEGTRQ